MQCQASPWSAPSTPPFRPLGDDDIDGLVARVRASGANILWIGLGTPRQDYLVHRLARDLAMPIVPVGAAFDYWSGEINEAPAILHGSGLEWLHRLVSEPRRLWHRYLVGNPRFLVAAWRHRHLSMRVLVAHNLYRSASPSGENQLVRAEVALLRDGGVDVVEMFEDSDTIPGGLRGVLRSCAGAHLLALRCSTFRATPAVLPA